MKIRQKGPSERLPDYYLLGEMMSLPMHSYVRKLRDPDLFGMIIPNYQRPLVWTPQQEVAYIESWYKGLDIGTFMTALRGDGRSILIDGQQRLHTLKRYMNSEFSVFDLRYDELTDTEQHFFQRRVLPTQVILQELEEEDYRDLYIRLNFSGTAHRSEDHPLNPEFQSRTTLKP